MSTMTRHSAAAVTGTSNKQGTIINTKQQLSSSGSRSSLVNLVSSKDSPTDNLEVDTDVDMNTPELKSARKASDKSPLAMDMFKANVTIEMDCRR